MPFDCRLQTPFNCLIAGPTKSGKTSFTYNLLEIAGEMFDKKPDYVCLYYMAKQPIYDEMFSNGFINEMIDLNNYEINLEYLCKKVNKHKNANGSLIIFDDTMSDIKNGFEKIFTVFGHHTNTSIIYLAQNLFYDNKIFRNMSLNFDYLVIMRNNRDLKQIRYLSHQLCPTNPSYVINSYNESIKNKYSYILIDCHSNSPNELRLRSHIFPTSGPFDQPYTVYLKQ
jgi:uridine kinase